MQVPFAASTLTQLKLGSFGAEAWLVVCFSNSIASVLFSDSKILFVADKLVTIHLHLAVIMKLVWS